MSIIEKKNQGSHIL